MSKDQNKDANKGAPKGAPKGEKGGAPKGGAPKGGSSSKKHAEAEVVDTGPAVPPRLRDLYRDKIRGELKSKFEIGNVNAMPKLEKIVLNVNMGRHIEGTKIPPHIKGTIIETLTKITGQKPIVIKAKKSVSNFKVREGIETAVMVTLRRERMWHFLDRLINLATPRIKDFRGVPTDAFDKQGNYSFGLTEQGVFPEINMADAQFTHGMHLNLVFKNSDAKLSRFVLEQMGMPFTKPEEKVSRKSPTPAPAAPAPAGV
ncbi:MAG: 50S ribosomal protein L5 [Phycisphaerae bacterium]|nr:50S ribosomal protein L5 [Phycisphaerae bacterium]